MQVYKWCEACGLCKHYHSAILPYKHHNPVRRLPSEEEESFHQSPFENLTFFFLRSVSELLNHATTNNLDLVRDQTLCWDFRYASFIQLHFFFLLERSIYGTDMHPKQPPTMVYFVVNSLWKYKVYGLSSSKSILASVLDATCQRDYTSTDVIEVLRHYSKQHYISIVGLVWLIWHSPLYSTCRCTTNGTQTITLSPFYR